MILVIEIQYLKVTDNFLLCPQWLSFQSLGFILHSNLKFKVENLENHDEVTVLLSHSQSIYPPQPTFIKYEED